MAADEEDRVKPAPPGGPREPTERKLGDMGKGSFEQSQQSGEAEEESADGRAPDPASDGSP